MATQLTTMGIPCIYYGRSSVSTAADAQRVDLILRENMFGGRFGLCTQGRHFSTRTATCTRLCGVIDCAPGTIKPRHL